uniref:Uncharacterized protein n=1 Tax=Paraburkholderia sprentiae WSM5005 TaxID=754502 RepID=A0A1I9YQY7_9BURK
MITFKELASGTVGLRQVPIAHLKTRALDVTRRKIGVTFERSLMSVLHHARDSVEAADAFDVSSPVGARHRYRRPVRSPLYLGGSIGDRLRSQTTERAAKRKDQRSDLPYVQRAMIIALQPLVFLDPRFAGRQSAQGDEI